MHPPIPQGETRLPHRSIHGNLAQPPSLRRVWSLAVADISPLRTATGTDALWEGLRADARDLLVREPAMSGLVSTAIIDQPTLEHALACRLAYKLAGSEMSAIALRDVFAMAIGLSDAIGDGARADLAAVRERDPACRSYLQPLLYFKGFLSTQAARAAHTLWHAGREELALFIQMRVAEVFSLDIHPAARLGKGIMLDHGTGIVIGETATVGDGVSMLHGVTLGGNGKETGDRHPKIGNDVLIGAGASILGNIPVGDSSRVGAGSVVLHPVPPNKTVAGVPARIVGDAGGESPATRMDHRISIEEIRFLGENI